jgi:hypothetical protein
MWSRPPIGVGRAIGTECSLGVRARRFSHTSPVLAIYLSVYEWRALSAPPARASTCAALGRIGAHSTAFFPEDGDPCRTSY